MSFEITAHNNCYGAYASVVEIFQLRVKRYGDSAKNVISQKVFWQKWNKTDSPQLE